MTYEAKQALVGYSWRGNVRQLRNVLERAAIVCDGGLIAPEHLSLDDEERPSRSAVTSNVKVLERQVIERVLGESGGNKSKAARRLGLTRKQLYVRLRSYERESVREPQ
jgi:DNA-binding NtrC family response regulator